MKRILSLTACLLMLLSLSLPVLATEEYWEAEVDTEETEEDLYIQWGNGVAYEQPEDGVISISPWEPESGEVYYEFVTVDPDIYQVTPITPENWAIGALDGEQIYAVPGQSLAIGPSRAYAGIPSVVLAVIAILAIIMAVALLVIIVIIAIVLIIKSSRKKKNVDIEAE